MDRYRITAIALGIALLFAAATNYVPAFKDAEGRVFGLFYLDVYKDALHVASGAWALVAALLSRHAAMQFLRIFGVLYFVDGLVGVTTGSSYLDLSLFIEGIRKTPLMINVLSSIPHLALGGIAILAGFWPARERVTT